MHGLDTHLPADGSCPAGAVAGPGGRDGSGFHAATASTVEPVLERALAILAEAAQRVGVADVADLAAEAAGRLRALRLEVAVVGEFKRGKSSLINALVGQDMLPVGVLPLTSVPTGLEQGDEGLVVEFADGRQKQYRLDQVTRFVTEEANSGNALGVARVTARLHTRLLDAGVRLVDTPGGVGSVHEHNTAATDAYLPNLDAAVLVTSADPLISGPSGRSLSESWPTPCGFRGAQQGRLPGRQLFRENSL